MFIPENVYKNSIYYLCSHPYSIALEQKAAESITKRYSEVPYCVKSACHNHGWCEFVYLVQI